MRAMLIDPGTRALVTGASKGIGRALCERLASRGARLGLLARGREGLEELAADLPANPGAEHLVLAADVTKRRETEKAIERFAKQAAGLDLLVANAGIGHYGPFAEGEVERAEEMIRVNVLGTVHTIHAALAPMLEAGRGHVVVVSSGAGIRAFPGAAVYGGTKAFERGFAEALRHELAATGIGVTTVFPGEVDTGFHDHQRDRLPEWRRGGHEIPAADVADAIITGVEDDRREVHVPKAVKALGLNGLAPRLTDTLVARLRGPSAAPRRD
jgi:short-subunit dehydrogenase